MYLEWILKPPNLDAVAVAVAVAVPTTTRKRQQQRQRKRQQQRQTCSWSAGVLTCSRDRLFWFLLTAVQGFEFIASSVRSERDAALQCSSCLDSYKRLKVRHCTNVRSPYYSCSFFSKVIYGINFNANANENTKAAPREPSEDP